MKPVWIALAAALVMVAPVRAENSPEDHWYHEAADGKWCSYATRNGWDAAWSDTESFHAALAGFKDGRPEWIADTLTSASGDWIIYDDYSLENGQVTLLKRQYNSFPDGTISLLETYEMQGGKLVRKARRLTPMADFDHELPDDPNIEPPIPPVERLADFGFFAVLEEKPVQGEICQ